MAEDRDKEQRTEDATARRKQEARDRGQVAMSTEFVAAVALAAGGAALVVGSGGLGKALAGLVIRTMGLLGPVGTDDLETQAAAGLIEGALQSIVGALVLVLAPAILVSALAGYGQVGFQLAPDAIKFDPNKVNPVSGFQRVFSLRGVVRTALAFAKVVAVGLTVAIVAYQHIEDVTQASGNEIGPLLGAIGHIAMRCAFAALVVILLLALIDLVYQRWQHDEDLKMTKEEVKEEHKLTEGDPHVKARVRQIQREMATRRMMADVPRATVVVTNPTHYAVALRYDRDDARHAAPVCVAKGVDQLAQRIKRVAGEAGVVLHEDVPLARSLHAKVEIGREIPEELYAAVAAVLSTVYRLEHAAAGRTTPA